MLEDSCEGCDEARGYSSQESSKRPACLSLTGGVTGCAGFQSVDIRMWCYEGICVPEAHLYLPTKSNIAFLERKSLRNVRITHPSLKNAQG